MGRTMIQIQKNQVRSNVSLKTKIQVSLEEPQSNILKPNPERDVTEPGTA